MKFASPFKGLSTIQNHARCDDYVHCVFCIVQRGIVVMGDGYEHRMGDLFVVLGKSITGWFVSGSITGDWSHWNT